jgi:general secretion pathway protein G
VLFGRRRTYIVNPALQIGMLVTSLGYVVFLVFVVAVAVFAPLVLRLTQPGPDTAETSDAALRLLYLHQVYWLPALLGVLVIALHSVGTSHRIAGPLYRFRRVCESMTAGVVPPRVTLRKGDQLLREADAVNAMLDTWRTFVDDAQRDLRRLRESVATCEHQLDDRRWADLLWAAEQLDRTLSRVRREGVQAPPAPPPVNAAGKRGGFTLVEILVVVALMGTIMAIGLPMYSQALSKARVTRAIADIKNISLTITTTQMTTGAYPASLAEVNCAQLRDPWGNAYQYLRLAGLKGVGGARKDKSLVPINSDFDLYSMGPDGKTSTPLTAKASKDDIVRANNGGFIGVAADY